MHSLIICEGPGRLSLAQRQPEGSWTTRALAMRGLWPCFSPDGGAIAISALEESREVTGTIELLDAQGSWLRTAHEPQAGAPSVIAPRVPHYVQWSPGGATLSFVAPGEEALGIHLSDRAGAYNSDRIATGAPVFHSWSSDSRFVAIHAGAELSIFDMLSRSQTSISSSALGFRTPVVAGDELVYALPSPPGVAVMACSPSDPASEREIGHFAGGLVLERVWGFPARVSIAVTREPDSGSFHQLWTVDLDDPALERRLVAKGPFAAAMWAPDGQKVALLIPAQTGDGRFALRVHGPSGEFLAATEALVPSQDCRTYMGFFDQYAISHHFWSPDSLAMVICGRLPGDGPAWSFSDRQDDYVWYWTVDRNQPLERLGIGDIAFFSPAG